MTDPDPLPAHEREVRAYAAESGDVVLRRHLTAVLRELDRLRAVEKAAAALVERWDSGDFRVGPVGNALLTALTDALNGDVT